MMPYPIPQLSVMQDRTTLGRRRRSPIDMTLDRVRLLVVCLVVSTWNGSYMVACLGVPLCYLAFSVVVSTRIRNAIIHLGSPPLA